MKERNLIVSYYHILKEKGDVSCALAVVVRVEGSSYRRMGARMLVCEDGSWIGGISGGCLEGDALKRARLSILKEKPSKIVYDTSLEDDHQIGVGLGCNGVIEVLFIPIDFKDENNPLEILFKATNNIVTVTSHPRFLGKTFEYKNSEDLEFLKLDSHHQQLDERLISLQKSENIILGFDTHLFVEHIESPIHIFLLGHQYDLYPLIELIQFMDWKLTVVANPLKIKGEIGIIAPENFDFDILNSSSAVILMSHSLETDTQNYKQALLSKSNYIGVLGPKSRFEKIWESINSKNDGDLARTFAPVGLDIGANTPEEIALSIVSEIKAVFADRTGKSLRLRKETINNRTNPMVFKK